MIMKRLIILMLVLMAMSLVGATNIHYYQNLSSYIQVPKNYTPAAYSLTRVATVFEPTGSCIVNNVGIRFYNAAGTHAGGNATATLRRVDAAGLIIETGLGAPAVTILSANLTFYSGVTVFDFAAAGFTEAQRTIPAGEKFAIVLSCPNNAGNPPNNTVFFSPLGGNASMGHSYAYWTDDGWLLIEEAFSAGFEWCWDADVTYVGNFIDIAAKSLYFTGDLFLQPGETIAYEADVKSNSSIPITADVKLSVYDQASPATAIWSHTLTNQSFPDTAVVHLVFPAYTYPAVEGDYRVVLSVYNALDMNADNNMTDLEQITFLPPGNMDYLNDALPAGNAFGWNADNEPEVGVDFWYSAAPLKLNTVGFRIWDNTWPANVAGHEFLKYAIYNWVEGMPNLLYVTPAPVPCVLGQWNDYDVSAQGLTFAADEKFMVTYKQYNLYPACPGLAVDDTAPVSGWATSYYWDPVDGWMLGYDDDFMIRAGVEELILGVEAPIVSIILDGGYPTIEWAEVTGAVSYNVYGSNDPEALVPWTPIESGIQDLGYMYAGTEPYLFFYVTASTEMDGSKMTLSPRVKTFEPAQLPARSGMKIEKAVNNEITIAPALKK